MSFVKNGLFNVFVYGCGLIVVNGLSFLMLPFYTRQFPPSDFALITVVLACLPFARYCLPLEICQAAPVFSSDDSSNSSQYVSIGFWFTLFMNLFCYLLIYTGNLVFHFFNLNSLNLISLLGLFMIDCLFYFASNILRWQLKPFIYNFLISGVAILEVILTVVFVVFLKLSIFGVFYSWIISRSLGFFLAYLVTRKCYTFTFDFHKLKKMLSFSIPLALSNIPYNLNRSFDRWIISAVMGLSAVGIYGAGSTVGGIINFIMGSFSSALSPLVYRNHDKKEAPEEIVTLFFLVITICMAAALLFALFNKELLSLLVSEVYYIKLSQQPITPIIVLSAIISGLYIFAPGLSIKRKTNYVIWFNIAALIVNAVIAYGLVHRFGIVGVAFATCVSVVVNTSLYMMFSQKYYPLPFRATHIVPLAIFFLLYYTAGIWLGMVCLPWTSESIIIRLLYCVLSVVFTCVLVLKACKEISKNAHQQEPILTMDKI